MDKDRTDPGNAIGGLWGAAGALGKCTAPGNEPHKIYLFKDSTILTKYPMANPFKKER